MKVFAVYRLFGADGELLYIGKSTRPMDRLREHGSDARFARDIVSVTVEYFDDRETMDAAERAAIRAEKPRHNVTYNANVEVKKARQTKTTASQVTGYCLTYSLDEAADLLGISSRDVLAFVQAEQIHYIQLRRIARVSKWHLHGWLASKRWPTVEAAS